MSKVITFSRVFPSYHPRKGEPTYFVEKIWEAIGMPSFGVGNPWGEGWHDTPLTDEYLRYIRGNDDIDNKPKHHTIRAGHRWKIGDKFSPRVWSGKPYASKQITFAPDIEIKKVWNFDVDENGVCSLNGKYILEYEDGSMNDMEKQIASNDGLTDIDFFHWLIYPIYKSGEAFTGQIICWNENINY